MKKLLTVLLVIVMTLSFAACGSSEPIAYDAPSGAPYEGLNIIDKMNSSNSYEHKKGVDYFSTTMKWKTENENIESAQYTDEFFLEWALEESFPYELCESVNDMSALKNNVHTIKPGEENTIEYDVDAYFDGLPKGYYRFVKVFDVKYKDGTTEKMVASFTFDLHE